MKAQLLATLLLSGLAVGVVMIDSTAMADETNIRLSTGLEYSSGKFGSAEDIEDFYVPLKLSADNGRFGVYITVPYLSVRAPTGTIADPDGQPIPGTGDTTTESGLGDVTASFTLYDAYYDPDLAFALDVTGAVKFGTADLDKGLGTGESDYSLYLDGYKWFESFTLLGSVGYRWRGEPEGAEFNNVFLGSIGGAWSAGTHTLVGVLFDYRESALASNDDVQEITGFASMHLNNDWNLELYAFTGFTDSSPDWGGGISVTTQFQPFRGRNGH